MVPHIVLSSRSPLKLDTASNHVMHNHHRFEIHPSDLKISGGYCREEHHGKRSSRAL